ncbi:cbb3-type cytochrome oxidase subunit [Roseivivax marinus]|jgi:cytochrome c oxidase cbb3-type subunit 4|uniref:Cbb3-type cytochrome oxidase subunit n=1 Tax=Roseivivax marinus TaxID=1379903 RepID=W4HLS9_9RHOB|nr:CcoQ/FixQ family Cbb3-type cytochrome c oxidase assembly chaperone [Roseivivax marinus]ETW12905.1 cbb3-type cytochrome oxidase subunit [Roseivivax marinus]UMA64537.1 CcoQ/FixQ family Cbb3-type cytochrome c oxidase assembly chaperone [Roseivivax marinus]SEL53829.1 cytochrome c oxidase cbb3-type subunit 4 [Roseivivax marinus]
MDTYSVLRHFADSWMLLAMTLFFLGICVRAFLPRMRTAQAEAASVIFRNDTPAEGGTPSERQKP